eukprot:587197-Alexandrium_andersonii.AAC.1
MFDAGVAQPLEGGQAQHGTPHFGHRSNAELLLPAWVDGVGVTREGQERALDILVRLGVLDLALGEADVAVSTHRRNLRRLCALPASYDAALEAVRVAEGVATGREDDVGMAQALKECRQVQCVRAAGDDGSCHARVADVDLIALQHEGA